MAGTLVTYDALVERRTLRLSWSWVRPYVPFVAMTAAYLWLRYALFGQVIREGQLSAEGMSYSADWPCGTWPPLLLAIRELPPSLSLPC